MLTFHWVFSRVMLMYYFEMEFFHLILLGVELSCWICFDLLRSYLKMLISLTFVDYWSNEQNIDCKEKIC